MIGEALQADAWEQVRKGCYPTEAAHSAAVGVEARVDKDVHGRSTQLWQPDSEMPLYPVAIAQQAHGDVAKIQRASCRPTGGCR